MKFPIQCIILLLVVFVSQPVLAQLSLESSYSERNYEENGTDYTAPRTDLLRSHVGEFVYGPNTKLEFKIVEDESGVKTTYYKVGALPYMKSSGDRLLPERLEDGGYRIMYYSVDQSGNQEQLRFDEIFLDKTGPEILFAFDQLPTEFKPDGTPVYRAGANLEIQVLDQKVEVSKVIYQINDGAPVEVKGTTCKLKASVNPATTDYIKLVVKAFDEFGNMSTETVLYQLED